MVPRLLKLYGTFFANKIRKTYVTWIMVLVFLDKQISRVSLIKVISLFFAMYKWIILKSNVHL